MNKKEVEMYCLKSEYARLLAVNADLLAALERAFNLIKESGFRSGLTEDEFDATLAQADASIAKAKGV